MVPGIIKHVAAVTGHERHRLCNVECSPSTEADHCVRFVSFEYLDARLDLIRDWIALDLSIYIDRQSAQAVAELTQHRQRRYPLVGDYQRPVTARSAQVRTDLLARPSAEVNARG